MPQIAAGWKFRGWARQHASANDNISPRREQRRKWVRLGLAATALAVLALLGLKEGWRP